MNGKSMMDNLRNLRPQIPKKEKSSTSEGKDSGKKKKDPTKPTFDEIEALSDKIEKSAKIFFPTFYCVFNIIYWAKYFQTWFKVQNCSNAYLQPTRISKTEISAKAVSVF